MKFQNFILFFIVKIKMNKKLSKYVYTTTSFNGKYNLLYNSKNDYFIRYDKEDFPDFDSLSEYEDIYFFLKDKDFYESENEFNEIKNIHRKALKSEEELTLILKMSKDCNFRCVYCYEKFEPINMRKSVENGIIKFIESVFKKKKIKRLVISWFGGEPLINIDGIENMSLKILDLCEKYNIEYNSAIVTNGYLLTKKNIEKLIKLKVNNFQITIDGPSYVHNKQRKSIDKKDTYEIIKQHLFNLKNNESNYKVIIRTNISKELLECMDDYEDDLLIKFNDDPRFFTIYHPVVDFSDCSHEVTDEEVMNLIINSIKKGIKFSYLTEYLSPINSFCYGIKENNYVIDVDGNVSKCTVVNEPYSIIGKIMESGELKKNSFSIIWENSRISDKCISCNSYASCGGGACPLYYLKNGYARCMKYKKVSQKELLLKIADLQESYDLTLQLDKIIE